MVSRAHLPLTDYSEAARELPSCDPGPLRLEATPSMLKSAEQAARGATLHDGELYTRAEIQIFHQTYLTLREA